jgi:hypothetical protein
MVWPLLPWGILFLNVSCSQMNNLPCSHSFNEPMRKCLGEYGQVCKRIISIPCSHPFPRASSEHNSWLWRDPPREIILRDRIISNLIRDYEWICIIRYVEKHRRFDFVLLPCLIPVFLITSTRREWKDWPLSHLVEIISPIFINILTIGFESYVSFNPNEWQSESPTENFIFPPNNWFLFLFQGTLN